MHVLIVCVGSAGDVYPFIAIGEALKARGHDVQLATSAAFRDKIEQRCLGFIETTSEAAFNEQVRDPEIWHPRKGARFLANRIAESWSSSYALLVKHVRPRETVLVASTLGMAARLVRETLGVPLATVHLAPSAFLSATDPGVLAATPWAQRLPVWAVRALLALLERGLDRAICPTLNEFRATLGLPPVRNIAQWMNSPDRVIGAFPAWFAAPQSDWPANSVCTSFPRLAANASEPLSDELLAFLDAGPPPIACTPGSAHAHGRIFFERAFAAAEALGMRAVFVTRYRDQLPAALPAWVHHEPYVPYDVLAPRISAFVHHGGVGTSATVLAAGTPQLIAPFNFDQPDNAARLKQLAVAQSVAPGAPVKQWVRALSNVLNDLAVAKACNDVAARMASETRAQEQIADLIEDLSAGGKVSAI